MSLSLSLSPSPTQIQTYRTPVVPHSPTTITITTASTAPWPQTDHQIALDSLTATLAAFKLRVLASPTSKPAPSEPDANSQQSRTSSLCSSEEKIRMQSLSLLIPLPLAIRKIKLAAPPSPPKRPTVVQSLGRRHCSYEALVKGSDSGSRNEERGEGVDFRCRAEPFLAYDSLYDPALVFDEVDWTPRTTRSETSGWMSPSFVGESEGNVWDRNWGEDDSDEEEENLRPMPLRLGMGLKSRLRMLERDSESEYSNSRPGTPANVERKMSVESSLNPWARDGRKSIARDLANVVMDFENTSACVEIFASLDVEALVADPEWEFEDHDALRGATAMDLRRHAPRRSCWCHWCELDRSSVPGARGIHDATKWCGCNTCLDFLSVEMEAVEKVGSAEWYGSLLQQIQEQERWAVKEEKDFGIATETETDAGVEQRKGESWGTMISRALRSE
ncbi:uncharacterized protein L3040_002787 [Drepanopeziza brunnea f. sp. 'multigermtubi']|uniref:uncharacterized protein n=1 Tax=Drepanopeziza brunnea f. sp. 'multigermtubi' TaxID=698441 RepID=UPI002389F296|nr:hypothetical protein L3040_002787 [Drepanopeziza brunnea f. sp. 'multigermtubi']